MSSAARQRFLAHRDAAPEIAVGDRFRMKDHGTWTVYRISGDQIVLRGDGGSGGMQVLTQAQIAERLVHE